MIQSIFTRGMHSVGLTALCYSAVISLAQAATPPDNIDAGQIEKRFEKPLEPLSKPKAEPEFQVEGEEAPDNAEQIRFKLKQLNIEEASVFDGSQLESFYQDLIGQEISLAQVYELAEKLTAYYGNKGYLLSRVIVPPQRIREGVVILKAVEGYIDEVVFEGLQGQRPDVFSHYAAKIKASRPLHSSILERYLLLANDLPGFKFKSVLNPSKTTPGAATLVMQASKTPWEGSVSLDNRGSDTSGPNQLLMQVAANDLFNNLESTSLMYATVPGDGDELRYWQLHHQQIINGEGLTFAMDWTRTDSDPGDPVLEANQHETASTSLAMGLDFPYLRSREENLRFGGNFSIRKSTQNSLVRDTKDNLRVLRLTGNYDRSDTWFGGGISVLSLTFSQGLNMAGAQVESRGNAETDFTHIQLNARRIQKLSEQWTADLRVQTQLANEQLPSSEQFGLGGERTVRGYEPSEWTGDSAFTASAELRYQLPDIPWEGSAQFFTFYDFGKVWREDINKAQEDKTTIVDSIGVGMRFAFPQKLSADFEIANALDHHADGTSDDIGVYGRISWQF